MHSARLSLLPSPPVHRVRSTRPFAGLRSRRARSMNTWVCVVLPSIVEILMFKRHTQKAKRSLQELDCCRRQQNKGHAHHPSRGNILVCPQASSLNSQPGTNREPGTTPSTTRPRMKRSSSQKTNKATESQRTSHWARHTSTHSKSCPRPNTSLIFPWPSAR